MCSPGQVDDTLIDAVDWTLKFGYEVAGLVIGNVVRGWSCSNDVVQLGERSGNA